MSKTSTYLGDGVTLIRDHHTVSLKSGIANIPLTRRAIVELYERTHNLSDEADAPIPSRTVPLKVVMPKRDEVMNEWCASGKGHKPSVRKETALEDLA